MGVEVTAGNVHDSVAWDKLYNDLAAAFPEMEALVMDMTIPFRRAARHQMEMKRR